MDTVEWAQGNGIVPPVENSIRPTEKKPRPEKEKALNCPRCNSTNTKFCYYNNYSLSQPRYFCKSCRRYWTQGGTFRNVPVGGGSRKARRPYSSNSSSSSISSKKGIPDLITTPPKLSTQTQSPNYQGQDLNLAYDHPPIIFNGVSGTPFVLDMKNPNCPSAFSNSQFLSFPMLDHFKSSFDFSLDNSICASMMQPASSSVQEHHTGLTSGPVFPLEEFKGASSSELGETTNSNGDWSQCWLGIPGEHM